MLGPRMYGVFLSGCLRQRWSQACLHCWARWILSPPPLSTRHALCLLQYWFSSPALIPCHIISAFQKLESLWAIAFGTCPVQLFYGEVRFLGSAGKIFFILFYFFSYLWRTQSQVFQSSWSLPRHAPFITSTQRYAPKCHWAPIA